MIFLALLCQLAFAEEMPLMDEPPLFDPPVESETDIRSERLGKMLRCPVCQGLSVADSRSDAAVAMQNRIREFVEAGYSDEQIVDYFVSRYGEWALLKPKSSHWFVWSAPAAGLFIGFAVVGWRIRKRQPVDKKNTEWSQRNDREASSYRERILNELDGEQ